MNFEKAFGKQNIVKGKLVTIDPPKIPKTFDNFAVCIGRQLEYLTVKQAKIMPSKIVKEYGVLPRRKDAPKNTFNCCIGDYEIEKCDVWLKDIVVDFKLRNDAFYFNARPMMNKHALASCSKDMIGEWHENSVGYYGFFKTKKAAVNAVKKMYEKEIAKLEAALQTMKNDASKIDSAFQEASK